MMAKALAEGGVKVALADLFQDRLTEAKKNFDTLAASKSSSGIDAAQCKRSGPACYPSSV